MSTDWLGGGLVIALAAVLWLVYLLPSWFRSRQYLATERNAVRLQQTLRILAETSEMPDEVRLEVNARTVHEQQRLLKRAEAEAVPAAIRAADRLRRTRAVASLVLVISLSCSVLGSMQAVYTGAWAVAVVGTVVGVLSIVVLARLSRAGRRLRLPAPASSTAPVTMADVYDDVADEPMPELVLPEIEEPRSTWTPIALPKPRYLADVEAAVAVEAPPAPVAEPAPASAAPAKRIDHQETLLRAAAAAEDALRSRLEAEEAAAEEATAEVESIEPEAAPVAPVERPARTAPSRFARMGIVDDVRPELDLNEILARRRAG
ncbi:hypothetical protein GCM10010988_36510 [Cnuibacter physcomitrellae]|uniref:Uncharacterized protein n=1 Tax=Cnuibacter physcomitrellae TaxID=1619308 RepID=A0A1X9LI14_9MICO|nr:hypothetical protein [Cnuibacter physcomitrellae]ARJ04767.1 hypothetical protein B5808_05680 [Cnuibacter physcomitrellae]GGI41933.1 hypothetical protein GCM10010988_36510 [Cnuibacter physcomitrellae]